MSWGSSPHGNPGGTQGPSADAHGGFGGGLGGPSGHEGGGTSGTIGTPGGPTGESIAAGIDHSATNISIHSNRASLYGGGWMSSPWGDPHGVYQPGSFNDPFGYGIGDVMHHYGPEQVAKVFGLGWNMANVFDAPTSVWSAAARLGVSILGAKVGIPPIGAPFQIAEIAAIQQRDLHAAMAIQSIREGLAKGQRLGNLIGALTGQPAFGMIGMLAGATKAMVDMPTIAVDPDSPISGMLGRTFDGVGDGEGELVGIRGAGLEDRAAYGSYTPGYSMQMVDHDHDDVVPGLSSALGMLSGLALWNSTDNMTAKNFMWDLVFVSTFARDADALSDFGDRELLTLAGLGSVGFLLTQSVENEYGKLLKLW